MKAIDGRSIFGRCVWRDGDAYEADVARIRGLMHKMIVRILMGVFILLNTISLPSVMHFFGELSYPGYQSTDLNDLHPDFRRKLTKVIAHLESEGYPVWVGSTWRDTERQQFYKDKGYSDTMDSLHRGGGEKAGTRRSKAADIYLLLPMIYLPVHAHFYHHLNAVSKK